MTWRLVVMKRVLQAGHWKSLKTSMTMGAFLEPNASRGSTSGTGAEDWRAPTPSADPSSSTKKPAKLKFTEFTLRRRSTQSSSIIYRTGRHLDITRCRKKILPVIRQEKKLCRRPCARRMHLVCYIGCVWVTKACAEPSGEREVAWEASRKEMAGGEGPGDGKALKEKGLVLLSTNLTRIHSTCILPHELTVG